MTIRLFRVHDPEDAIYMSQDGKIQLAFRDDHEHFEALPLFMDVSLSWDRLSIDTQAYLYGLSERWAARGEA